MINFAMMWYFGFATLAGKLGKAKSVKKDCKKFHNSDQFFEVVYEGIIFMFSFYAINIVYSCVLLDQDF